MMITWQVNNREEGLKLLDALLLRAPSIPAGYLRQLVKKGRINIDGHVADFDRIVTAGEYVQIAPSLRLREITDQSPLTPEQIVYEDNECMVVNKPAGLAVHNAPGQEDNLIARVQSYLQLRKERFLVAPVQRLDIGTSGVVLIGKGKKAIRLLGKTMMAGEIAKHYIALVHGQTAQQGELVAPVKAKGKIKDARARYHLIASNRDYSLLSVTLGTGRQHQIRQQLAEINHPIVGDTRYGRKETDKATRMMLHSKWISLTSPCSNNKIQVSCPVPSDFASHISHAGIDPTLID